MLCEGVCVDCGASVTRLVPEGHVAEAAECLRDGSLAERVETIKRLYANKCDACEEATQERRREMDFILSGALEASGLPPEFVKWNADKGNNELLSFVREYGGCHSLFIASETGKGKTRSVCSEGYRRLRMGEDVRFVHAAEGFDWIWTAKADRQEPEVKRFIQAIGSCDLLILDDLDKAPSSPSALNAIWLAMDGRYKAGRRTWTTANHGGEYLAKLFGEKYAAPLLRRLVEESATWSGVSGANLERISQKV